MFPKLLKYALQRNRVPFMCKRHDEEIISAAQASRNNVVAFYVISICWRQVTAYKSTTGDKWEHIKVPQKKGKVVLIMCGWAN